MSVPHGLEAAPARPDSREAADGALVRLYHCAAGHVTAIRWAAEDAALAVTGNDFKIYCPGCNSSRFALPAE